VKQKTISLFFLLVLGLSLLSGCAPAATATAESVATAIQPTDAAEATVAGPTTASAAAQPTAAATTNLPATDAQKLTFNNKAWQYDATNDVYWQIGVQYVASPATTDYETLGIYVPGAYVTATANGDGTYTLTVNTQGSLNGFTAQTAPMVLPVNTPGYSAAAAPTAYNYDEISIYMKAGFIYVQPGLRGRNMNTSSYIGGAPWGVTDFKAAVRFIRYNKAVLPGNTDSIFAFGMSGGGAQTSIIGASGDSPLYYPYLESLGAAMLDANGQHISDAVTGAMAWCPITSLDTADEAYEWNMGQYSTSGTRADGTFTAALSKDLAAAYAEYINQLGIKDVNGNVLTLEKSDSGIYAAGSYYNYLMATIEESLNNFLADTTFPYTESAGGFPGGGMPQGGQPPAGGLPQGNPPAGAMPGGDATSTTYQTVEEYFNALNKDGQWVTYNATTNTAKVTSLSGFVNSQKTPSKTVTAFDGLERSVGENNVFGTVESSSLHFDAVLANLLATNQAAYAKYSDWNASYVDAYATDLTAVDKLGSSLQTRVDMYNPMYYLLPYYKGYQTATVAKYWRINTGIKQGDTANTVEMNLALALKNYAGVDKVEFTTVWGQGHTMAERTGDSTSNFIAWVTGVTQQ
jgi:hypothetical protein